MTVPEIFRDAHSVVRSAEQTNNMLRCCANRALERQVDAEVEEHEGHGVDVVQLWQDVGGDFRNCLKASDDLVRTVARLFVGMGKILREVSTLRGEESTIGSSSASTVDEGPTHSPTTNGSAVPRTPRGLDGRKSREPLRGRLPTNNLRRGRSSAQLRPPSWNQDLPPTPAQPTESSPSSIVARSRPQTPHDNRLLRRRSRGSQIMESPPPLPTLPTSRPAFIAGEREYQVDLPSLPSPLASERLQKRSLATPARANERRDMIEPAAAQEQLFSGLSLPSLPTTASPNLTPPRIHWVDSAPFTNASPGGTFSRAASSSVRGQTTFASLSELDEEDTHPTSLFRRQDLNSHTGGQTDQLHVSKGRGEKALASSRSLRSMSSPTASSIR
ncbi:hypothetical protein K488DRAFT_86356 [Vararia minispora EC-137]|uniref:Uncharacterized protein n=1 Tax=Vararia minispora EC-137 TaxID=1314806 RepID=A0ACB8QJS3_9AGAM|nr:hypothetical protein K488DRAFT_86356 [Vararia minispora EC-137]